MTSTYHSPQHQQVCWSAVVDKLQLAPILTAEDEYRRRDEEAYQKVHASTPQPGIRHDDQDISFHPMLSDKSFIIRLQQFHEALVKAVVNIVDRWWEDRASDFPSRMPLEPEVEEILQMIDEQSKNKSMPAFADCLGVWRPDFLLIDNGNPAVGTGFQVCEINSRTPFNAIIHTAYKHGIMRELLGSKSIIEPAGDFDALVDGLFRYFDLDLPIHIVRGRDNLDRQEFALLAEQKTGSRPRLVTVSDLQLRPDSSSETGFAIYCSGSRAEAENKPERVHQVALALFPEEYSSLSQDMLHYLAKVAVNDFRTSLLVNDQRFLGIILQELNDLVENHNILTSDEAKTLQAGIVPTILPGSRELKELLLRCRDEGETMKNDFIFKAARSSRGKGHILGDEISKEEWEANLLGMQDPNIRAGATSYVLQPYIQQPKFDILAAKNRTVCGSQMVGTYYTANGRFAGLGPWRTGNGKICNVYSGGCVLVTSVTTVDS